MDEAGKFKTYKVLIELKVRDSYKFQVEDFLEFVKYRLNLSGFMTIGKLFWCGEVSGVRPELHMENLQECDL